MRWSKNDFEISHLKGSGPGGQNRNKRMTGVRITHLPTGITVLCTERRSQEQNLKAAYERIKQKLERFFYVPTPRVDTRPTKGSKKRRVENKKRHSSTKRFRKRVSSHEGD